MQCNEISLDLYKSSFSFLLPYRACSILSGGGKFCHSSPEQNYYVSLRTNSLIRWYTNNACQFLMINSTAEISILSVCFAVTSASRQNSNNNYYNQIVIIVSHWSPMRTGDVPMCPLAGVSLPAPTKYIFFFLNLADGLVHSE